MKQESRLGPAVPPGKAFLEAEEEKLAKKAWRDHGDFTLTDTILKGERGGGGGGEKGGERGGQQQVLIPAVGSNLKSTADTEQLTLQTQRRKNSRVPTPQPKQHQGVGRGEGEGGEGGEGGGGRRGGGGGGGGGGEGEKKGKHSGSTDASAAATAVVMMLQERDQRLRAVERFLSDEKNEKLRLAQENELLKSRLQAMMVQGKPAQNNPERGNVMTDVREETLRERPG
ncbi:hypothetical protein CBR_g30279 [Chara braunii]|uniref:Uncharacterized protein n=1 Tax=Chara braunii TaxID=69332 RepID=A0A388LCK3_CHABU|nr:hypothetical protein CBR_g30279 [Chara braunii]|eukprot:GBG80018.1 hypothetical protein CBR_g30279 [Chara braunii]